MKNKLLGVLFLFTSISLTAGDHGSHSHGGMGNSEDWEIKAYTSAAPAFIGDHATVIGASGKVLRRAQMDGDASLLCLCQKMALKTRMNLQLHAQIRMLLLGQCIQIQH